MTTQSYQNLSPLTEDINYPQDEVRHTNSESSIQELEKRQKTSSLEERKKKMNTLFGLRPWKPHVTKRPLEERSPEVKTLYIEPTTVKADVDSYLTFWNVMWTLLFGWWLSLIYIVTAFLLALTIFGIPYAKWCWQLKSYFFWPFGKYIVRLTSHFNNDEERRLLRTQRTFCPKRNPVGFVLWLLFAVLILLPAHVICFVITWMLVIFIPMAKVNQRCIVLLFQSPLTLKLESSYPGPVADVKLCTHQAVNVYYYKYTVGGMNVILFNLIPFVIFSLIEGYLVPESYSLSPIVMFCIDILSIIPISFYIGMAVSSIAVQTTYIIGALLNAGFGTIVEIILYAVAIKAGHLDTLVQFGITGTLLAATLLLPGFAMIAGGLKYKEQQFNPVAAGVSSVMLTVSVAGAFTPTIFYEVYGNHSLHCTGCVSEVTNGTGFLCGFCEYLQLKYDDDPVYVHGARPLMYFCAAVLPLTYVVGLIFTLKTHSHIFESGSEQEEMKEHAPEWSIPVAIVILLVCSVSIALIAENLIDEVQPLLKQTGLTQSFLGLTVFAVVPEIAEFINAVLFALQNNISLSFEVAAASAVQTALIQIPVLVVFSAIWNRGSSVGSFTLIFPVMCVAAVIFSVLVLNYVSIRGKSNYFEGASLCFIYALIVAGFYFIPEAENVTTATESKRSTGHFAFVHFVK